MPRERLDKLVVLCGLVENRSRARAMIMAGQVLVDDRPADKCGALYNTGVAIRLAREPSPYVSRGGHKLEAALSGFGVEAAGKAALDIGASTGGFTDCLLAHGARRVLALDVGYGQLAWRLRGDERVTVIERCNFRYAGAGLFDEAWDIVVADVSFIGLKHILPRAVKLLDELWAAAGTERGEAEFVVLVKPQFELGPEDVEKGGLVKDPAKRRRAVDNVLALAEDLGMECLGSMDSPLPGQKGNREFFVHLRYEGPGEAMARERRARTARSA